MASSPPSRLTVWVCPTCGPLLNREVAVGHAEDKFCYVIEAGRACDHPITEAPVEYMPVPEGAAGYRQLAKAVGFYDFALYDELDATGLAEVLAEFDLHDYVQRPDRAQEVAVMALLWLAITTQGETNHEQ
jgi:hypothetical protein